MTERMKGNRLEKYLQDYTVIDLETTGVSVNSSEIIEVSAVKVRNGKVENTFSTLVKPERRIPHEVSEINGITNEMVKRSAFFR